ncbi:SET domain-containing protein 3 [Coemansia aciculifera]|uniref:SET domain-containing protein 3 n=1 Tax=Coemansia aciculifera TaxID=417176 RepID=A0ACC1M6H5_9FUNG|nr:SET domain-containing protein 3 [Coemansia aciculifera]
MSSRNVKEARKRPKHVSGKVKRAEDPNERRKRAPDSKVPRPKSAKLAASRESSSPAGDKGREAAAIFDNSYIAIERNILGADVQVLFQSVLSQLASQRSAAAAAATTLSTSETPASEGSPTEAAKAPELSVQSPVVGVKGESAMVAMADDEISQTAAVYRGFASRDRGQIGLFAREAIASGRYICEYRGQVQLKAAYKEDPKNYYELLRTTRRHSHFYPDIDLCVDARRQGSDARFVRRSCEANVALRSIYVPGSGDSLIHLGLFTTRSVQPDEELTVSWEWDDGELPAVARMSASDAEDYLGRPEGRRMSKVWRQAFGGITCACADLQCNVRRLFAMLGVEETVARPDSGAAIKRRPSRPHKIDTDGVDAGLPSPTAQSVRSPDSARAGLGSHSRKGSMADLGASPDSPLASRGTNGASNGDTRSMLSVFSAQRAGEWEEADCGSSSDVDADDDESSAHKRPINGHRGSNAAPERLPRRNSSNNSGSGKARKRKSSIQTIDVPSSVFGVEGSKKQRSTSGSPVSRKVSSPGCSLPLKKLWMSQYLEKAEVRSNDFQSALLSPPVADALVSERDVEMSEVKPFEREASRPLDMARSPSPLLKAEPIVNKAPVASLATVKELSIEDASPEEDQALVRSLPTDSNAPTPTPTDAVTLLEQSLSSGTTDDAQAEAVSLDAPDSVLTSLAPSSTQVEPKQGASTSEPVAIAVAKPAPVKKQRLSLEEYNKRRRGNTATPASADSEAKEGDSAGVVPASVVNVDAPLSATGPSLPAKPMQPHVSRSPPPPPPPPLYPPHPPSHLPLQQFQGASSERDSGSRFARHGLHMPQPQRGDWRPVSRGPPSAPSASAGGVNRALSMSPGPYHHAAAAPGGVPRRTGLGPGGSRGGSPSRK